MTYFAEIIFLITLLFFAGLIWLQIFLSNKRNKWLGLIIPFICFMFSIMTVLGLAMFTTMEVISVTETINGNVVTDNTTILQSDKPSMISMLATALPVFLIANIPTLVFLAIYYACREKIKRNGELERMVSVKTSPH